MYSEKKSISIKNIDKKKKKLLSSYQYIAKTELVSAHLIAGKIIFEKLFKMKSKKKDHNDYIDKFLLERGNSQNENNDFLLQKINEIKTPLVKKRVNNLINEIRLSRNTSSELANDKNEKKIQNYKKIRNGKNIHNIFLKFCLFFQSEK